MVVAQQVVGRVALWVAVVVASQLAVCRLWVVLAAQVVVVAAALEYVLGWLLGVVLP